MGSYVTGPAATTTVLTFTGIKHNFYYNWIFMSAEVGGHKPLQVEKGFLN